MRHTDASITRLADQARAEHESGVVADRDDLMWLEGVEQALRWAVGAGITAEMRALIERSRRVDVDEILNSELAIRLLQAAGGLASDDDNTEYTRGQAELIIDTLGGLSSDDKDRVTELIRQYRLASWAAS